MNKKDNHILMILSIFIVALFLTGCSQNAATKTTGTTTSTDTNTVVNTPSTATNTPSDTVSNPATTPASTSPSSDSIKDITIEAFNFDFVQTGPAINKGDKVRLTFTVTEGTHSLVLSGYNIEFTPMTAGNTQSVTFIADKSGTFNYHCNNPCGLGHLDMVGKFVVN